MDDRDAARRLALGVEHPLVDLLALVVAQGLGDDPPARGAGRVGQPLELEGGEHVGLHAVAVALEPRGVERLVAGGDDHAADVELQHVAAGVEVDALLGALLGAGAALLPVGLHEGARRLIDEVGVGHRLGERDVDRLALGDAGVELARDPDRAHVAADVAGHAGVLVDASRVAQHGDPERAGHAADGLDLGVGEQLDHRVLPDGDHLGRQDAGGAVEGGERLVEHRHVAADGAAAFDQVDLLAPVGDLERRLDAGDASPDHERGRRPLRVARSRGERERDAVDGAGGDRLGALCRAVAAHPVFAERREPHFVGLASRQRHRPREGRLEESRRVAGDHDPVELVGGDLVGKRLRIEPGQQAEGPHHLHLWQVRHVVPHRLQVGAAVRLGADPADVDADPHRTLHPRGRRSPRGAKSSAFFGLTFGY